MRIESWFSYHKYEYTPAVQCSGFCLLVSPVVGFVCISSKNVLVNVAVGCPPLRVDQVFMIIHPPCRLIFKLCDGQINSGIYASSSRINWSMTIDGGMDRTVCKYWSINGRCDRLQCYQTKQGIKSSIVYTTMMVASQGNEVTFEENRLSALGKRLRVTTMCITEALTSGVQKVNEWYKILGEIIL